MQLMEGLMKRGFVGGCKLDYSFKRELQNYISQINTMISSHMDSQRPFSILVSLLKSNLQNFQSY